MPQATQDQIDAWKAKHGDVFEIRVADKFGYLKCPDRKTAGFASAAQGNPVRSNEILLKGCWIDGDKEILEDDKYFLTAQSMTGPLLEAKEAEIKKL